MTFSYNMNAQLIEAGLDRQGMKDVINADSDKPRIVTILGALCPACQAHRDDFRDEIMANCDNPDLRWIIFWFEDKFHDADSLDAVAQAALVSDPRAEQYWCSKVATLPDWIDSVGYDFGGLSWNGCSYFWDASILYEAGTSWTAFDPPAPSYCMAKVGGCCNTYSWSNFKADMDSKGICNIGVGIDATTAEVEFELFPNPSDGHINLSYNLMTTGNSTVFISDMSGKVVKTFDLENSVGEMQVDLSQLGSGLYFCKVVAEDEVLKTVSFKLE